MDFGRLEALKLDDPTERDVEWVEEALGDLDRMESDLSVAPSHAQG
ncbi:hypothetical protein [Sedimentitalea xiamensis]|nr:hypothetical protein [Sedimentitalea xiamensis]